MKPETKTTSTGSVQVCQNCKNQFIIEPDDFVFYEKISVPPPAWCPKCRLQRQLSFRNERSLYKRKCDAPGHDEELITIYSPDNDVKIYDQKFWWSDAWDALDYGRVYDFRKPFFNQFSELMHDVPWPNLVSTNSINSDYCNSVLDLKNCYLIFAAIVAEDSAYGANIDYTKQSFDIKDSVNNELCYEILHCYECYRVLFSSFSSQCTDSAFLWDCRGCSNCFGCVGLRNKSYYIFNKPYSKEEYFQELKEFNLGSFESISSVKKQFGEFRIKFPYKYARIYNSVNTTGDNVRNGKNCFACFDAHGEGTENCRHMFLTYTTAVKDCQSVYTVSAGELCYDSISIRQCSNVLFSKKIWTGHNIRYSYNCHNCTNLFGCVGLRSKEYCVLNKQYSKEEYEALVPKIVEHMNSQPYKDKLGRIYAYGEFFPPKLSLFGYNETIAQEYFPLTEDIVEKQGYTWRDSETKEYNITLVPADLPDHIKDVKDSILNETIGCAASSSDVRGRGPDQEASGCTTAFKLIPQELQFYRKMNLPLPRLCPNCRHYQRLKQRNPLKLWHRKCQCAGAKSKNSLYENTTKHPHHGIDHCQNEFETTYSPESKEIVYCEQCYNKEVV